MNTKTLLIGSAVSLLAASSVMAQVYSVNSVGYVNTELLANKFVLIANPLNSGENKLSQILPVVPENTALYRFDASAAIPFTIYNYAQQEDLSISWGLDADAVIKPGEGFLVLSPSAFTVTFVGEVPQGSLTNRVPTGLSLRSSIVPQTGPIQTVLGYPASPGDTIHLFDANAAIPFDTFNYDLDEGGNAVWDKPEPVLGVGRAAYFDSETTKNWTRNFSVN